MRNRYVLLASTLVVGVLLDQWSKHWADEHLGTIEHPLPVHIAADEAGRTISEVLRGRFDLDDAGIEELQKRGAGGLVLLYRDARPSGSDRAFPRVNDAPRPTYYWAFHHQTLELPPRRIPLAQNVDKDLDSHADALLEDYLVVALPYLSDDARAAVLADYLYAAVHVPVGLDRVVKEGESYLLLHRPVPIIDGFLQFKYAENPGAAWGFLADQEEGFRKWFFLLVSLIAVAVISTMFFRLEPHQKLPAGGFAIILSGAIGNFIDRVRFNFVIDFVDMYVGESHWPTYNVADVAITMGVALLLIEVFVNKDEAFLTASSKEDPEPEPVPEAEAEPVSEDQPMAAV